MEVWALGATELSCRSAGQGQRTPGSQTVDDLADCEATVPPTRCSTGPMVSCVSFLGAVCWSWITGLAITAANLRIDALILRAAPVGVACLPEEGAKKSPRMRRGLEWSNQPSGRWLRIRASRHRLPWPSPARSPALGQCHRGGRSLLQERFVQWRARQPRLQVAAAGMQPQRQ